MRNSRHKHNIITMKKVLILVSSFAFVLSTEAAQISRSQYVEMWKEIAVQQMLDHNIPASITLAQGILESGSGNSKLATEGNNHFGIKCHGWTGSKMYMDDDAAGECFRVYKKVEDSYTDHSEFLKAYSRYAFLFTYDVTDYESWAKGLKKAGYATSSTYPEKLIKIIEEMDLAQYDQGIVVKPELIASNETYANRHSVSIHSNKVKFIIAKEGDTFYQLSKEFDLTLNQLYKYNNFNSGKDLLVPGDIVYIQPKRRASIFKKKEITLNEDMSVAEISQKYALNIKSLKRLNDFSSDDQTIVKGDKVTLR